MLRKAVTALAVLVLIWGAFPAIPQVGAVAAGCTIVGTDGDDVLVGTDGDDVICGGAGDDLLIGGPGADTLHGGDGHDRLAGGIGNDRLFGDAGNDQLTSGGGNDQLDGGAGDDQLVGGFTNDSMSGGSGTDICENDGSDQRSSCESDFGGTPVRIMAFGDSITEAPYPSGRYRTALADHLDENGCRYDYVGSVVDQALGWGDTYDPDHEGHGGWTADDLLAEAPGWFTAASPDVVIIHAGTNDLYSSHTTTSTVADIEALIGEARAANPTVSIIVARIISGAFIEAGVLALNDALDVAIPPLDQPASSVVLVDQHAGFDLDVHAHDRIHPNDDGASRIADRFWGALAPLVAGHCFSARPVTPPPTTTTTSAPPTTSTTAPPPSTTTTAPPPATTTTTTTSAPPTTSTTIPGPVPTSNLVENPSVEATTNAWTQDTWGDLTADFSWHNEGADGKKSLRVSVTQHTWGDAKWVSNKAPTTPDTNYHYTESYRATAGSHLVAHHVKTDGTSIYNWIGFLPAVAGWTTHTTTVATPPNTTHTRIFHVLGAVGTLDIDNTALHSAATPPPPPTTTTTAPSTTTTAPPTTTTTTTPAPTTTSPPTTTTTTPPGPVPEANLIENPSVESATDPWTQDIWGDLTADFTWHDEGADGNKSLRVNVTQRNWGDAKWISNKAPTSPDTSYHYTESYKATAGTNLVAHHVKIDGTSTYTWIAWLPQTNDWTTHTTTITTPPDTTHTRVFHVLNAVGTLDIDNTTLQPAVSPPPTTTTTTAPPTPTNVVRTVTGPDGLTFPHELATDSDGRLYMSDFFGHRVYRINPATGVRTVVAGSGSAGYSGDGGLATQAALNNPVALAFDDGGNLYIADHTNHLVRRVDLASGIISTVAGTGVAGETGDGGPATAAQLNIPEAVAVSSTHLYIGVWESQKVKSVNLSTGVIETIAAIPYVAALAVDAADNLYVSSMWRDVIYKITPGGTQTIFAGTPGIAGSSGDGGPATAALINHANGLDIAPDGSLIISDSYNRLIRRVDGATGIITTIVGTGTAGYSGDGGSPLAADIDPDGVAVGPNGEIYWAQPGEHVIRSAS